MQITRKCHGCHQDIRKDEMIQYSSVTGKTTHWFCKSCYEEKMARKLQTILKSRRLKTVHLQR